MSIPEAAFAHPIFATTESATESMSELNDESQIDEQLEKLSDEAGKLIDQAKYRSSYRLFGELRQRAKRERRLYHYVLGTFHQMDQAQYLYEFQTMRERAIELIALLESEEQCRKIQPDMALPLFEGLAYQFSSCAYENLAEATGQMEGYNSEGLQACIADGLQICRQTGKLSCVGCFREYSCDVYMSADDSEIRRDGQAHRIADGDHHRSNAEVGGIGTYEVFAEMAQRRPRRAKKARRYRAGSGGCRG